MRLLPPRWCVRRREVIATVVIGLRAEWRRTTRRAVRPKEQAAVRRWSAEVVAPFA
jgi:hypothetical protein